MMKAKPVGATIEKVEARKAGSKTKYVATMTDGSELVLRTSGISNYRWVGAYHNEGEKPGVALGDSYVDVSFHARRDLVKDGRTAIEIDGASEAKPKETARKQPQELKQPKSMMMSDQAAFQVEHPWYRIPRNIHGRIQVVDRYCRRGLISTFDVETTVNPPLSARSVVINPISIRPSCSASPGSERFSKPTTARVRFAGDAGAGAVDPASRSPRSTKKIATATATTATAPTSRPVRRDREVGAGTETTEEETSPEVTSVFRPSSSLRTSLAVW